MEERKFYVKQDAYKRLTVTWEVYAESFDDAEEMVRNGYGDLYDEDEYDTDYEDLEEVTCGECDETESYCECEKEAANEFLAEIGL